MWAISLVSAESYVTLLITAGDDPLLQSFLQIPYCIVRHCFLVSFHEIYATSETFLSQLHLHFMLYINFWPLYMPTFRGGTAQE
jgi:hypothetical protein